MKSTLARFELTHIGFKGKRATNALSRNWFNKMRNMWTYEKLNFWPLHKKLGKTSNFPEESTYLIQYLYTTLSVINLSYFLHRLRQNLQENKLWKLLFKLQHSSNISNCSNLSHMLLIVMNQNQCLNLLGFPSKVHCALPVAPRTKSESKKANLVMLHLI